MSKELIEFLREYGDVLVFLAAFATIVSGLIAAATAFGIELLKTRAERERARATAHRAFREKQVMPIMSNAWSVFQIAQCAAKAFRDPTSGAIAAAVKAHDDWKSIWDATFPLTEDQDLDTALSKQSAAESSVQKLIRALQQTPLPPIPAELVDLVLQDAYRSAVVVQLTTEAFVYDVSAPRVRARGIKFDPTTTALKIMAYTGEPLNRPLGR